MAYQNTTEKSYDQLIAETPFKPSLAALLFLAVYTLIFAVPGCGVFSAGKTALCAAVPLALWAAASLFALPRLFALAAKKTGELLQNHGALSASERTELLGRVMGLPFALAWIFTAAQFCVGVAISLMLFFALQMPPLVAFSMLLPFLFAAFAGALVTYTNAEAVCTSFAERLVAAGIDKAAADKTKCFGMKMPRRIFYHICLPAVLVGANQLLFVLVRIAATGAVALGLAGSALIVLQTVLLVALAVLYKNHTVEPTAEINGLLEKIHAGSGYTVVQLPSDLGTELAYTFYSINNLLEAFQRRELDTREAELRIAAQAKSLAEATGKSAEAAASEEQNLAEAARMLQAVRQNMEELAQTAAQVAENSGGTLGAINHGAELLDESNDNIMEITTANIETISGIKNVSGQIDAVWSFISTIDTIAERTRTIAFNTEIESTATGENADNFHIIATEIRRLANSITDSTREIRKRIVDIQHSTDNLIITSEGGTEKIREESELFANLNDGFDALRISGQVTQESFAVINENLARQRDAFNRLCADFDRLNASFNAFASGNGGMQDSAQAVEAAIHTEQGGDEQ